MIEHHPFEDFIPPKAKYLILGSFPGQIKGSGANVYNWYYGSTRNQFWMILSAIYKINFKTIEDKKRLLNGLNIALSDVILECERVNGTNSDQNLRIFSYNQIRVEKIILEYRIEAIFFTSKFVEKIFTTKFLKVRETYSGIRFFTLPSPSPRNAKYTFDEKVAIYKKSLPKM